MATRFDVEVSNGVPPGGSIVLLSVSQDPVLGGVAEFAYIPPGEDSESIAVVVAEGMWMRPRFIRDPPLRRVPVEQPAEKPTLTVLQGGVE